MAADVLDLVIMRFAPDPLVLKPCLIIMSLCSHEQPPAQPRRHQNCGPALVRHLANGYIRTKSIHAPRPLHDLPVRQKLGVKVETLFLY
eukprot:3287111-Amphidinium_carterae.1